MQSVLKADGEAAGADERAAEAAGAAGLSGDWNHSRRDRHEEAPDGSAGAGWVFHTGERASEDRRGGASWKERSCGGRDRFRHRAPGRRHRIHHCPRFPQSDPGGRQR